jgi:tetratricopeptide (TPR) repeat protein
MTIHPISTRTCPETFRVPPQALAAPPRPIRLPIPGKNARSRRTDDAPDPGFAGSSASAAANGAFARAVHAVAAHRPDAAPALAEALTADPNHVGAHALTGFGRLMLARAELAAPTAEALAAAQAALARRDGGTADERALVAALALAADGRLRASADLLDQAAAERPAALLSFKLSQGLRFMCGDRAGMLRRSSRALDDLEEPWAAGFVLGCHAFALEEHALYDAAEAVGHRAVTLAPEDSWGRHAVAHVHEMRGETALGVAWIEDSRAHWSRCNNFSFHMAWHLALLHLEQGDHDRVLDIYDREVRPAPTDDFRDMANAVSLLWRLETLGVDVGDRWGALAGIARARQDDVTLVFAALHNLTALVAIGDREGAAHLAQALEARATGADDQAGVARRIGAPFARLLSGLAGPGERRDLDRLLRELPRLGGSNAQRDVFLLALARIAGAAGDGPAFDRVRRLRVTLKAEDRLIAALCDRALPRSPF